MRLDPDVVAVLGDAQVADDGRSLTLVGQLERGLYLRVAKAIEAAGGKWSRRDKAHVFPEPAEDVIADMLATGSIVDSKREEGYFPTPPDVVERLLAAARIERGMLCLEPSAGEGAIADALVRIGAEVDCVELNSARARRLLLSGHSVYEGDFLSFAPQGAIYDRVVMNPPFGRGADVRHVGHALACLKPGGRLVAVMAAGIRFRQDRTRAELRMRLVQIEDLPAGSFKSSGTMVNAVIVVAE